MRLLDMFGKDKQVLDADSALSGSSVPLATATHHFLNGNSLHAPYPENMRQVMFGMGCFWGVERIFWQLPGVYITAVGYAGGHTPNATYEQVCNGKTGHNEVVLVVFDPNVISFDELLRVFWEGHDPTQGMQQGNDRGTQYRSGIYTSSPSQKDQALASKNSYQEALDKAGREKITTEILDAPEFYFAEEYHQQYLEKNPDGYCGIGGTGVSCPIGSGVAS